MDYSFLTLFALLVVDLQILLSFGLNSSKDRHRNENSNFPHLMKIHMYTQLKKVYSNLLQQIVSYEQTTKC